MTMFAIYKKDLKTEKVVICDAYEDEASAIKEMNRLIDSDDGYGYKVVKI